MTLPLPSNEGHLLRYTLSHRAGEIVLYEYCMQSSVPMRSAIDAVIGLISKGFGTYIDGIYSVDADTRKKIVIGRHQLLRGAERIWLKLPAEAVRLNG